MPFIILGAIIILGLFLYYISVRSRKYYKCPKCGEKIRVEHMEAENCNICGAPLEREG